MIRLWPYVGWCLRNLWASTPSSIILRIRFLHGMDSSSSPEDSSSKLSNTEPPWVRSLATIFIPTENAERLHEVAGLRIVLAGQVMRRRAGGVACENVAVNLEAQKLQPVDLAGAVLACPVAFCCPMRFVCASCPPVLPSFCEPVFSRSVRIWLESARCSCAYVMNVCMRSPACALFSPARSCGGARVASPSDGSGWYLPAAPPCAPSHGHTL